MGFAQMPCEILNRILQYVVAIDWNDEHNYIENSELDSSLLDIAGIDSERAFLDIRDHSKYQQELLSIHHPHPIESTETRPRRRPLTSAPHSQLNPSRLRRIQHFYEHVDFNFGDGYIHRREMGWLWRSSVLECTGEISEDISDAVPRTLTLEKCANASKAWRNAALAMQNESVYIDERQSDEMRYNDFTDPPRLIARARPGNHITTLDISIRAHLLRGDFNNYDLTEETFHDYDLEVLYREHNLDVQADCVDPASVFARFQATPVALRFFTLHTNTAEWASSTNHNNTPRVLSAFLSLTSRTYANSAYSQRRISPRSNIPKNLTHLHLEYIPQLVTTETVDALMWSGIAHNLVQLTLDSHNAGAHHVSLPNLAQSWEHLQPPFKHLDTDTHGVGIPLLWSHFLPAGMKLEVLRIRGAFLSTRELALLGSTRLCPSLLSLSAESTNERRWDDVDAVHRAWFALAERAVETLTELHVFDCCGHMIDAIAGAKVRKGGRGGLKVVPVHSWRCEVHPDAFRTLAECVPIVWYGRERQSLQNIIREFDGRCESEGMDLERMSDSGDSDDSDDESWDETNMSDSDGMWDDEGSMDLDHESASVVVDADQMSICESRTLDE
ncbi:hypothetical protein BJ742DRAFT_858636 [Cladochytrium replicatum]|nr:hypothetical protein BJ742DRAFT_858636 [Cladochytrium replicatum]